MPAPTVHFRPHHHGFQVTIASRMACPQCSPMVHACQTPLPVIGVKLFYLMQWPTKAAAPPPSTGLEPSIVLVGGPATRASSGLLTGSTREHSRAVISLSFSSLDRG
jgi:hypothetical protein